MEGHDRAPSIGVGSRNVLTLNGGSSSIKFAIFSPGEPPRRGLHGEVERIGRGHTTLSFTRPGEPGRIVQDVEAPDHAAAVSLVVTWLARQPEFGAVSAIGHRLVHGMSHIDPELVGEQLLRDLERITPCDPEHLPGAVALIEAFRERWPAMPQVACFDTAFHRDMPCVARLLPLPRRLYEHGIRRYGFHGLSYAYVMGELERVAGATVAQGRVIVAHLGSGASMAAVRDGSCIDTSMGFSPSGGLMMSTRAGDLDPGVAPYVERTEQLSGAQFHDIVNHASGLLGVSGSSADMRDLLAREDGDVRAAEAVALFCYQARKWIGSYVAALGGLDTLVFTAGIGENAPPVRARICDGLGFLGLEVDKARNARNAPVISTDASRVTVRVIRTDEQVMIAKAVWEVLDGGSPRTLST